MIQREPANFDMLRVTGRQYPCRVFEYHGGVRDVIEHMRGVKAEEGYKGADILGFQSNKGKLLGAHLPILGKYGVIRHVACHLQGLDRPTTAFIGGHEEFHAVEDGFPDALDQLTDDMHQNGIKVNFGEHDGETNADFGGLYAMSLRGYGPSKLTTGNKRLERSIELFQKMSR